MRVCKTCKVTQPLDCFPVYTNSTGQSGRRHKCKTCRNAYNYERKMVTFYGITKEKYDAMYAECAGTCMTCGADDELVIDHCHTTGKVRGLLCHSCNVALGHAKDSATILRNMLTYIEDTE